MSEYKIGFLYKHIILNELTCAKFFLKNPTNHRANQGTIISVVFNFVFVKSY